MSRSGGNRLAGCPMSSSLISTCSSHRRHAQQATLQRSSATAADELEPCLQFPPHGIQRNSLLSSSLTIPRPPPPLSPGRTINTSSLIRQKKDRLTTSLDSAALIREKHSDCVGKCVLCLFINAIFIFGVFLAFLIGHWASSSLTESFLGNEKQTTNTTHIVSNLTKANIISATNMSNSNSHPSRHNPGWTPQMHDSLALNTNANTNFGFHNINNNISDSITAPLIQYMKANAKHIRIPTIYEIYPPSIDEESSHYSSFIDGESLLQTVHRSHITKTPENSDGENTAIGLSGSTNQPLVPLPRNVLPSHYDIQLDFTEFSTKEHIRGNVTITLESFGNATDDELVFHAASNIFIHRIRLRESVKRHFQKDLVRVILNERLKRTWYNLEIEFRTKICQYELEGVHCIKATQLDKDNSTLIANIVGFSTKFEPCFARTFMPSWDEPRVKTTFNVSIRHPASSTSLTTNWAMDTSSAVVLTNTPPLVNAVGIAMDEDAEGTRTTRFATTPRMPIYLLAFAIGPWTPLELRTNRNMPLTIWVDSEDVLAVHFAANFSPVMFDRVEEDFGLRYPLNKMDFVVVNNFPVGGMENFGLIVFHSDTILLSVAPSVSSASEDEQQNLAVDRISEQYKIQKIITHEIVHQWFGNLVTMHDFEDLWLSEGFATYFVFDFLNEEHPHLTEIEYYQRLIELLHIQSSTSPMPLIRPLNNLDEINEMFDGVHLYTKGAVIVKMIKDLVGAFDFRAAVTRFLKMFAFKSVDRNTLWSCFPTNADHGAEQEKLSDIFQSWLFNEGMPEVIVSRNYEDQSIRLTQRPADQNRYVIYLNDGSSGENAADIGGTKRKHQRKRDSQQDKSSRSNSANVKVWHMDWDNFTASSMTSPETAQIGEQVFSQEKLLDSVTKSKPIDDITENFTSAISNLDTTSAPFDESYFTTFPSAPIFNSKRKPNEWNSGKRGSKRRRLNIQKPQHHHRAWHSAKYEKKTLETPVKVPKGGENSSNKVPVFSRPSGHYAETRDKDSSTQIWLENADDEGIGGRSRQERAEPWMSSKSQLWWIPFSYSFGNTRSTKGQTIRQFWLKNDTIRFVDVGLSADQYFLANPHWIYPYKVNYDVDNWKMLITQLHKNHLEIPVMSRLQLLVDAETYLKQSGVTHLYVHFLSYLKAETELGILLTGLDSIYSLVDLHSASTIVGPLLLQFAPIIQQIDRMLEATMADPELAALWLLSPHRLAKLYQLRCLANLGTCENDKQVTQWLSFPTALDGEHHQQITAICNFLFSQAGPSEIALLMGLLRQKSTQWSVTIQLATCVRDETLIRSAVEQILRTRNAAVFASALKGSYSIQYNRKFREIFWRGIANMSINERQILFAVNTGKPDRIARILLHSVRGLDELNQVESLLHQWPDQLRVHFKYLRRKLEWVHGRAREQIHRGNRRANAHGEDIPLLLFVSFDLSMDTKNKFGLAKTSHKHKM
ncbi:peptidase family m1 domain-containing protein [Ditylenchus destructor]|uniref:Peptidase family m1 domain-containing protein n=1 Tax=Ditylenchus destructor TaxID=166010 RepID=A0AAD4NC25_9BILA|nr:peptidase family m1 domain-containing protein [Ditylenchus destructor]